MIKGGANNRDVKKINRIRTMRSIFACERISQPELAAKVGNSWPTVLQNVKELMEMGLVQEVGTFESTGGRKAKAFAPVRNARYAVGLEITQNHIGAVLVDLSGELVRFERKKRPFERCDTYAAGLAELVKSLLEKEGCPTETVLGVGISLPGILDRDEKTLVYSHALGLRGVPVEEFSRCIPFPCRFINDANAAGLAEIRGRENLHSLVYLSLSNSVGGSIFTGGSLYAGEHLRAGEFGHMTLVPALLLRQARLRGRLLLRKGALRVDRRQSCAVFRRSACRRPHASGRVGRIPRPSRGRGEQPAHDF